VSHTKGPYRLAAYPNIDGTSKLTRQNDGALILLAGHEDDTKPIAAITYHGNAKRGQQWKADDDAEQLATARLISLAPELLETLELADNRLGLAADHFRGEALAMITDAREKARAIIAKAKGETE